MEDYKELGSGELEFFSFLIHRSIKTVYKQHLKQIEKLLDDGIIEESEFDSMRNRILDCGNEQIRSCEETIKNYLEIRNNGSTLHI